MDWAVKSLGSIKDDVQLRKRADTPEELEWASMNSTAINLYGDLMPKMRRRILVLTDYTDYLERMNMSPSLSYCSSAEESSVLTRCCDNTVIHMRSSTPR